VEALWRRRGGVVRVEQALDLWPRHYTRNSSRHSGGVGGDQVKARVSRSSVELGAGGGGGGGGDGGGLPRKRLYRHHPS